MGQCIRILSIVIFACSSINLTQDVDPQVRMFQAVVDGDSEQVQRLLRNDPQLAYVQRDDGNTPLHIAALLGKTSVVKTILDKGANSATVKGKWGDTPLYIAARFGYSSIVDALLADDPQVVLVHNDAGETPLDVAVTDTMIDIMLPVFVEQSCKRIWECVSTLHKAMSVV